MFRSVSHSEAQQPTGPIWSIQYLRAFASIIVVVFHQLGYRAPIFLLGRHGVDIFFVISGFIMVTMTDGRQISPGRFILDRLTRIVPLYWLATALVCVTAAANLPIYGGSARLDWLAKSLLFIPSRNVDGHIWPTLFVGWTLNMEMLFYAIFALGLFLPGRWRIVLLATALGALVFSSLLGRWGSTVMFFYSDPIVLEFLAGAIVGKLFGIDLQRWPWWGAIGGSVAVIIAMIALRGVFPALVAGWAAVAIVVAGLAVERAGKMPRIPALKRLGDASFAIYLFQPFAFAIVFAVVDRILALTGLPRVPGLAPGLSIAAAIMLGLVVYSFIEKPMTRIVRAAVKRDLHLPADLAGVRSGTRRGTA